MQITNPEQIRKIQTELMLDKNVPKLLGISDNEFVSLITQLPAAPPGSHGKVFHFPVLVEPRLILAQCLEISTIQNGLKANAGNDLVEKKECLGFSQYPYWLWCGFLTNKNQARIITSPFPGNRWVTASEGIFFLMYWWEEINLEQREFTCPASNFKNAQRIDQFLTFELTKKTFMENLGLEINLRTNEPDHSPIIKMQLTSSARDLLGFDCPTLFCAWPPDFDWSNAPAAEEPKLWKRLIP